MYTSIYKHQHDLRSVPNPSGLGGIFYNHSLFKSVTCMLTQNENLEHIHICSFTIYLLTRGCGERKYFLTDKMLNLSPLKVNIMKGP